jgi:hypothetical protein
MWCLFIATDSCSLRSLNSQSKLGRYFKLSATSRGFPASRSPMNRFKDTFALKRESLKMKSARLSSPFYIYIHVCRYIYNFDCLGGWTCVDNGMTLIKQTVVKVFLWPLHGLMVTRSVGGAAGEEVPTSGGFEATPGGNSKGCCWSEKAENGELQAPLRSLKSSGTWHCLPPSNVFFLMFFIGWGS